MGNEEAIEDSAFYDMIAFVIKFDVIYAQVHTCALDMNFLISQELPNEFWAAFFSSKGMICLYILSIYSRVLDEIWVYNVRSRYLTT